MSDEFSNESLENIKITVETSTKTIFDSGTDSVWMKQKPILPGYYWLRNYQIEGQNSISLEPQIVYIWLGESEQLNMSVMGGNIFYALQFIIQGEWYAVPAPPN